MAKRLSSGQSNTLLNYFQSPKTPKGKAPVPQNGTPKSESISKEGMEKESPEIPRKRKKLALIDSDSEEENSAPESPTPKKKKPAKRTLPDSEDSDSDSKPTGKTQKKKFVYKKPVKEAATPSKKNSDAPKAPVTGDIHSKWFHNRLEFLQPENILDINKKRPDDPDYDPRTLFVPKNFLDTQTPAMRQWWILKSEHLDSVLFFKVGKFYELYHMDAVVGVTQLGFSYMKGEFAHSGFPESAYHKMATALVEKGFKVARTEQTETPEMMAERLKKQGKNTKFDKVVNREICQISTKATCVYSAQLPEAMHSLSCYMYAITEKDILSQQRRFGICFIDTSIGTFHMAEFDDDKHCSKLLGVFAEYSPGLILTERQKVGPQLKAILNSYYKDIRKDTLASESQFYSAEKTIEKLLNGNYFRDENEQVCIPDFFKNMITGYSPKPGYELTLKSLGASLWYLQDCKLDIQILSMGKFEMYHPLDIGGREPVRNEMILDSITLFNLNLFGEEGSLQKTLNHCNTAFGKRKLQQWICRPLCNVEKIKQRQEAITELVEHPQLLGEAQQVLKKLPDLERELAKIHTYGNRYFAKEHPDSRAIFYEADKYSKRRILDLLKTLQGFELAQNLNPIFNSCKSPLLRKLTQFSPEGMYVDLTEPLQFFKTAFDQEQAKKDGKVVPKPGVDDKYDEAEANIKKIHDKLERYLAELQKFFGCKVTFFGNDKKRFQIDVPESHTRKVTNEFQLEGTKKGAKPSKRYSTPTSRQLLQEMLKAEGERSKILLDLNRKIFEKFSDRHLQWEQAIECLAIFDVLSSLAEYAITYSHDICIPEIEPISDNHKIDIINGRHPCISNIDVFVPNDTRMGVDGCANILLLTGPNMGGKSTLMRQVALICIMAQIGSYVPASKCHINLIDRIFTRLGAHDDIIQGQSTFLVELSEASSILKYASPHSLLLIDELGRGTSTHDGNAIATAYVEKLTEINARTLFSTHYHTLVDQFVGRMDIQLGHMACMVENDEDPTEESVTFLYKMARGRCPKSYGFNVAKLAGMKHSIISRGRIIARQLVNESKMRLVTRQLFTTSDISVLKKMIAHMKI